jgi:radical SAM protein with 4Fe4S-binding SPASM domain
MAVIGGMDLEKESLLDEPALCNRTMAEVQRVADALGMQIVMPIPLAEANALAGADVPVADEGGGNALVADAGSSGISVDEYLNHKNREFLLRVKKKKHHNRPCYFPWYYIHVNPDGTVFPCGSWWEHTSFGDFKTQTFAEIWTGPQFKELRRQLHQMKLRKTCANCAVSNMGRPDVKASFSQRAKFRAAARAEAGVPTPK